MRIFPLLLLGTTLLVATLVAAHGGEEDAHLDTGRLERGYSAEHILAKEGTVRYACKYHPDTMRGTFDVRDDAALNGTIGIDLQGERLVYGNESHARLELDVRPGTRLEIVNREATAHWIVQEAAKESAGLVVPLLLLFALVGLAGVRRSR